MMLRAARLKTCIDSFALAPTVFLIFVWPCYWFDLNFCNSKTLNIKWQWPLVALERQRLITMLPGWGQSQSQCFQSPALVIILFLTFIFQIWHLNKKNCVIVLLKIVMFPRTDDFSTPICFFGVCVKYTLFCQQGLLLVHQWGGCTLDNTEWGGIHFLSTEKEAGEWVSKCVRKRKIVLNGFSGARWLWAAIPRPHCGHSASPSLDWVSHSVLPNVRV